MSGYIPDIEVALQGNLKILWTEEDDSKLKETRDIDDPAFRYLIHDKGISRIKSRYEFLEIEPPFSL